MKKVAVVVLSRANFARSLSVLKAINQAPDQELQLIVGGSALIDQFGCLEKECEALGFEVRGRVDCVMAVNGLGNMVKNVALAQMRMVDLFEELEPDIVVTIADRYETMATALAAAYMNIPLAHVQGGELTGSIDEKVRHAITKLADIHFVSNAAAAGIVRQMGEHNSAIHIVGCPSIDLVKAAMEESSLSLTPAILSKLDAEGVGSPFDEFSPYVVGMFHPVTTEYEAMKDSAIEYIEGLKKVRDIVGQVLLFWPNVDAGSEFISKLIRTERENGGLQGFRVYKNFPPQEFLAILKNSKCLIGNSSSGIREGSFLGLPVVNIGSRQAHRERGPNVIDSRSDRNSIFDAAEKAINRGFLKQSSLYGHGGAGDGISKVLSCYKPQTKKDFQKL